MCRPNCLLSRHERREICCEEIGNVSINLSTSGLLVFLERDLDLIPNPRTTESGENNIRTKVDVLGMAHGSYFL